MTGFRLPAIPRELKWVIEPIEWRAEADGTLAVVAGRMTDTFTSPAGHPPRDNAPLALFAPPDDNFLLSAKVTVDFVSAFDAGALQVRVGDGRWAKLCLEASPLRPTVVSVVTRGVSDDCNSVVIEGREVYLRMAVTPKTMAFHYSLDGALWHFVRFFSLGEHDGLRAGFSAQSPAGEGCRVVFSEIEYRAGVLKDNRSGE